MPSGGVWVDGEWMPTPVKVSVKANITPDDFFENHVLPIMGERQDSTDIYEDMYLGVINTVLIDCLGIENAIRKRDGVEELPVHIYEDDEPIPYDEELLYNCAVYGVASRLFVDEAGDESNKFIFLENNYDRGKEKYMNAQYEDVDNVWGVSVRYGDE